MKRGNLPICLVVTFMFLLTISIVNSQDVPTILEVPFQEGAPELIKVIPDQSWPVNTNNTEAFDLDEYFRDNETSNLTYTATFVSNINISIEESLNSTNGTMHLVSFYPETDFTGTRLVRFIASDGTFQTQSNIVTLNVVNDTEPPQWSFPAKDKLTILQNDFINFTTLWTDNVQLSNYTFSINQGSGWSNSSRSFSGTMATSAERVQISAPGGTIVQWMFFASDTSGNMNATDIQSFTVTATNTPPTTGNVGNEDEDDDSPSPAPVEETPRNETQDFSVSADSFRVEAKQGSRSTISLKVTNTGVGTLNFTIGITGLDMFDISISEDEFSLIGGDSKTLIIEISTDRFTTPDLYFGDMLISAADKNVTLPIIVEVKPIITSIDLKTEVIEEEILPGEDINANITLTNLEDIEEKEIELYYAIIDYSGNTLDSNQETLNFSSRSLGMIKNLTIPSDATQGEYIFLTRVVFDDEINIDSDTFLVGARFDLAAFLKANLILVLIALFLVSALVFILRYRQNKQRLKLLNLYLLMNQMKSLLEENKIDEAINIYIKIKGVYGEPLSQTAIYNKEELKKSVEELAKKLDLLAINQPPQPQENAEKPEQTAGSKNETKTENPESTPAETDQSQAAGSEAKIQAAENPESTPADEPQTEKTIEQSEPPEAKSTQANKKARPKRPKSVKQKRAKKVTKSKKVKKSKKRR